MNRCWFPCRTTKSNYVLPANTHSNGQDSRRSPTAQFNGGSRKRCCLWGFASSARETKLNQTANSFEVYGLEIDTRRPREQRVAARVVQLSTGASGELLRGPSYITSKQERRVGASECLRCVVQSGVFPFNVDTTLYSKLSQVTLVSCAQGVHFDTNRCRNEAIPCRASPFKLVVNACSRLHAYMCLEVKLYCFTEQMWTGQY